ncbi:MAG: hypothetical protein ACI86P_002476, partial [Flavobacteriales bacterium]
MARTNKILLIIFLGIVSSNLWSQSGTVKGRVFNAINNEPIAFATIVIEGTQLGVTSDENGLYKIDELDPGSYNITCTFVGFKRVRFDEIRVSSTKATQLDIPMEEVTSELDVVTIKASAYRKSEESPVSLQTISATEIYRNPGGNRDVSKVIQILPGVGSTASFRNDIIVRGGAPNENRFYLDGIEVPNINHFATQGSSGGPVGMLNVNFMRELDFYAGAFPVNRGNALSSVLDFKQIEGNDEQLSGSFQVGSSDAGLTLDGPIGDKTTILLSVRRSYLQFLFKAIGLPFLPTYNDFQYKQVVKFDKKNQLTIIGLGAIDDFELNLDANDGVTDIDELNSNNYVLGVLPVNSQWNYAVGANYKHFSEKSYQTVVVSRNHLNNKATKYFQNIEQEENLLLFYNSAEIENKFRFENTKRLKGFKWNVGFGFENVNYENSTFSRIEVQGEPLLVDFNSELSFNKMSAFSQLSKSYLENRLSLSIGIRTDFNDYSDDMNNPLEQISPRLSASYGLTDKLSVSFNIGRYYQLPAYTVLGFRNFDGNLINKDNNVKHIQADHIVFGLAYNPTDFSKITLEGFQKTYSKYPFLLRDSISLANLGGDFGVIGNEPVASTSDGRSYGLEVLIQQKLSKSIYGIISYTYVRSEFEDKNGVFKPSAWDNQHILNVTAGKKLKKNWEVGMRFRYLGGAPFTPFDRDVTARQDVWDISQSGVLDWNRLNAERNQASHGLDLRIDKTWYFKKWSLNAYLDIQNAY